MRRPTLAAITTLVIVTVLAAPATAGSDPYKAVRREMRGVPCKAEVGAETSKNLKTLANSPVPGEIEIGELDIEGDLAVGHIYGSPGGLVTTDVSDPLKPRLRSVFKLDDHFTYDVKITTDRSTALLGFDDGLAFAGIAAVDIRDPDKPRLMSKWISPRPGPLQNAHMLYTERIDGTDWIFLAPNDGTGVWILKLVGKPGDRKVEFVTQTFLAEGGPLGPHDMYIGYDKELKKWVLYAADGYEGWLAYDVSDPTTPILIGGFPHPSSGYTHTIQSGWVSGKRIVATVEEVGVNLLKVYDATNLMAPVLLDVWFHDGGPVSSQHNLQIVKNHLYVAHYSSGVYAFDLRAVADPGQGLPNLEPVARYRPQGASFWDVVVEKGVLFTSRFAPGEGFDAVGFGCIRPGDPAFSSTG